MPLNSSLLRKICKRQMKGDQTWWPTSNSSRVTNIVHNRSKINSFRSRNVKGKSCATRIFNSWLKSAINRSSSAVKTWFSLAHHPNISVLAISNNCTICRRKSASKRNSWTNGRIQWEALRDRGSYRRNRMLICRCRTIRTCWTSGRRWLKSIKTALRTITNSNWWSKSV